MGFKLDLHFHTQSFGQTVVTEEDLRRALVIKKLDGLAVVNFFNISHALWIKESLPEYLIIVGQEIWSSDGHIIGLGLRERVADFRSAQETVAAIHDQGGIAVAVHPYLHLGAGRKVRHVSFDAVEVYNASIGGVFFYNYWARRLARQINLPGVAATDTTAPDFLGYSYTEVLTDKKDDVLSAVRRGEVRLMKKAFPIPAGFILKNFLDHKEVEPCALHAAPCYRCGKSLTVRLIKKKFVCDECGKTETSRIACCQGHYCCQSCLVKRIHARDDLALKDKNFYLAEKLTESRPWRERGSEA